MEERTAEELIAVCRRGNSLTLDQAGDVLYCLECAASLGDQFQVEGARGAPGCGGEYQWVTKADLHSKRARCSRCGEPITVEPRLSSSTLRPISPGGRSPL